MKNIKILHEKSIVHQGLSLDLFVELNASMKNIKTFQDLNWQW